MLLVTVSFTDIRKSVFDALLALDWTTWTPARVQVGTLSLQKRLGKRSIEKFTPEWDWLVR